MPRRNSRREPATGPKYEGKFLPFEGTLQEGCRYEAVFRHATPPATNWLPEERLRTAMHQVASIDWTHADDFPVLKSSAAARLTIQFEVVTREVEVHPERRMSEVTWHCKVLNVLSP